VPGPPPIDLSFDRATFSGSVPLFPLPRLVHLPGALLPLHVFEPRYRTMIRDARAGERLLGMALLRPGYEAGYDGNPAVEPHVCVGRIALEQALADGRWNLLLVGLRRARIVEEDWSRPYRVARVELLEDEDLDPAAQQVEARALAAFLRTVPPRLVKDSSRLAVALQLLEGDLPGPLPLGSLVDLSADVLTLGLADRLRLLETPGVPSRRALVEELMRARVAELESLRRDAPWPPRFGRN